MVFGRPSRCAVLAVSLVAAGCGTTIRQEDYIRLSASYSLADAKYPFAHDPQFTKIGGESLLFDFKPVGIIGVERVAALRDEVVERANGFAAGYEFRHKNDGPKAPSADLSGRSQAWREGFSAGARVAQAEWREALRPDE
jgi:hypothetical protein